MWLKTRSRIVCPDQSFYFSRTFFPQLLPHLHSLLWVLRSVMVRPYQKLLRHCSSILDIGLLGVEERKGHCKWAFGDSLVLDFSWWLPNESHPISSSRTLVRASRTPLRSPTPRTETCPSFESPLPDTQPLLTHSLSPPHHYLYQPLLAHSSAPPDDLLRGKVAV
jgi:hypothetical protein